MHTALSPAPHHGTTRTLARRASQRTHCRKVSFACKLQSCLVSQVIEALPALADLGGVGAGEPEGLLLPEGGDLLAQPVVGRRVGEGAGGAGAVEAEALGEGGVEHLAEQAPPLLAGHEVTAEGRPGGCGRVGWRDL